MYLLVALIIQLVPLVYSQSCSNSNAPGFCDECGKIYAKPNVRIVGGTEAVPNSWPSVVMLLFNYQYGNEKFSSRCGGTIINRDSILTAAHCYVTKVTLSNGKSYKVVPNAFYPSYSSMYTVYIGMHTIPNGVKYSINSFTLHPSYNGGSLYDLGIIRLVDEIVFDEKAQPACLPFNKLTNYPSGYGLDCWAAGWGTTSYLGSLSDVLRNVKLKTVNSNSQALVYAGVSGGGKDTCQGDSGGPLFIIDAVDGKTKYIQIGITAFGTGCGFAGKYGGYTKVSYFISWITSTITTDKSSLTNGNSYDGNYSESNRIRANLILYFGILIVSTVFVLFY